MTNKKELMFTAVILLLMTAYVCIYLNLQGSMGGCARASMCVCKVVGRITEAAAAAILHTACQVLAVSLNKKEMSAFCVLGGSGRDAGRFLSQLPSALMIKSSTERPDQTRAAQGPVCP